MKYLYCYILISLHSVLLAQSIDQPDITYPEIYEEEVKENIIASDLGPLEASQIREVQKAYKEVRLLIEDESFKNVQSQNLGKIDNLNKGTHES